MKNLALLGALLLLGGCASHFPEPEPEPDQPQWAPPKLNYSQVQPEHGSAYRSDFMLNLFTDRSAYRVGDILTVALDEQTQASKKADTSTSKLSNLQTGFSANTTLGSGLDDSLTGTGSVGNDFSGTGSSSQQNKLSGSITVTVAEVLPNGVLLIRGEKWLRLNQGDEYLRILGLVRPDDIDNDNTLSSQRIADARIIYGGKGAIADSNRMGWAQRYFQSPWFPM
ncbi:flagellar basal body L-ring protein FlgH [Ferrimonas lipolytica]|uniref:Flagellar L-ring protein n=1 Tax=Ferrimonas lipolytica TaxID=2724191 RepID=A0A6H1UCL7_9GAMM|nr:flagellar basal body L-ring protein FlgH [Ferrimonas lipolytica]QIZ76784.1 flagellar basal body L-ring protein FlgH [Ferrimonas lipolytica]